MTGPFIWAVPVIAFARECRYKAAVERAGRACRGRSECVEPGFITGYPTRTRKDERLDEAAHVR